MSIDAEARQMNTELSNVTGLWRQRLQANDKGNPLANAFNVAIAFEHAPELAGCVRFDTFGNRLMKVKATPWSKDANQPWTDADDVEALNWLQENDIQLRSVSMVSDAVKMVANRHAYDPLSDYLNGLVWDGSPRLEAWLTTYAGAEPTKLNRAISRAFLISAVARGLEPGAQVDHVLCLEGGQGSGKTQIVRTLGGEWTQEHLPDLHSKDGMSALAGCWMVELSELAAMSRSEIESTKSFITRRIDKYRPAYGRHTIEQPRRCVFIATTNEGQYLRDTTGNRRFWPVSTSQIDIDALAEDRDQLLAEAVQAYRKGEQWYFTDPDIKRAEQAEQAKRVEHDPWLATIAEHLSGRTQTTTAKLLDHLGIERSRAAGPHAKRIAGIMRQMGWVDHEDQSQRRNGGNREVIWRHNE